MRRRRDNYAVWISPLWALDANALRCGQELGAWHRTEEPVGVVLHHGTMSLGPTRANVAETHQGGIGSLPQGAPRALRRRERRCYPPAAFTSAAHAFSPASPYGLLLARARFCRFSRH